MPDLEFQLKPVEDPGFRVTWSTLCATGQMLLLRDPATTSPLFYFARRDQDSVKAHLPFSDYILEAMNESDDKCQFISDLMGTQLRVLSDTSDNLYGFAPLSESQRVLEQFKLTQPHAEVSHNGDD